jgi:hypothetical protein
MDETKSISDIKDIPDIKELPLLDIFSKDIKISDNLLLQIDAILLQRLANEISISRALKEGMTTEALNFHDVVKMHNGSKDSLSDLVKLHRLLSDLSTENISHSVEEEEVIGRYMEMGRG